jgi:hypothetical protein
MHRIGFLFLIVVLLLNNNLYLGPGKVLVEPAAPTETPTALVASGVTSYARVSDTIYWHTGVPACPSTAPERINTPLVQYAETIQRIATYGSPPRTLYSRLRNCGEGQILSNIAADASYIYWLTASGLMRLSNAANPGDAPMQINTNANGYGRVAVAEDRVYVLYTNGIGEKQIDYVMRSNFQRGVVWEAPSIVNLQVDDQYVYFIQSGVLKRIVPGETAISITSGVTGYFPEGRRLIGCNLSGCNYSHHVYIGKGRQIYIYDNSGGPLTGSPIYTSPDTTAEIYGLDTDFDNLFFFEKRDAGCTGDPCITDYANLIVRTLRDGSAPATLYANPPAAPSVDLADLSDSGGFIFWGESGALKRLPGDSSAMPQVDLRVDSIEVTQGIQDAANSVILIKNKRTFVRAYALAEGTSVSGVTAKLEAPDLGLGPLWPVNPAGNTITVPTATNYFDINQSFLFELPWNWTQNPTLRLRVTVNPNKVPLEPNYANNSNEVTVSLVNSPTFSVEFFRMNYTINGVSYQPRLTEDVLRTYDFIQRLYPLGGTVGQFFKPRLWDIEGGELFGSMVDTSNPICQVLYPDPNLRNLCASAHGNAILAYLRITNIAVGGDLSPSAFYYGMITDTSGYLARGQAIYDKTSVGPAGTPDLYFNLGAGWDADGTYADWYAAHEIGHSLGRAHPYSGSDDPDTEGVEENCGHSRSDPSYPYGNTITPHAPIGFPGGSMTGLDTRYPEEGLPILVLPNNSWNDIMSYCPNEWISDYTYEGMYLYMTLFPSGDTSQADAQSTALFGDYLVLSGMIDPDVPSGSFTQVRSADAVRAPLPVQKSQYSVRLLNALDLELATELIDTVENDDLGILGFTHVMEFAKGARKAQLIRNADGRVLATQLISAASPVVSNVHLVDPPTPVTGVVTLDWTASDLDSRSLTFDVLYSRDNGATYVPVMIGLSASGAQINTARLGGTDGSSTGRFQVIASDGANSAHAESAAFIMADQAPEPYILTPKGSIYVRYGQVVNFSGVALDAQDGTVADSGLLWKNGDGDILGTGPLFSTDSLPVGLNLIVFQATNMAGKTASKGVWVHVSDDLELPGPILTAGPGMVGWQVPTGATAQQYEQVKIANAGSGSLTWTASEDASWLSLGKTGGTIAEGDEAASLVLIASPAGLASGRSYSTDLILTKPATSDSPEQTLTIPVTLSIGAVRKETPNWSIFLPILRR